MKGCILSNLATDLRVGAKYNTSFLQSLFLNPTAKVLLKLGLRLPKLS